MTNICDVAVIGAGPYGLSVSAHLRQHGIEHLTVKFGFSDDQDLPKAMEAACLREVLELAPKQMQTASYFVSRGALRPSRLSGMQRWRKRLFVLAVRNASDPVEYFALPDERVVILGARVGV